MTNTNHIYTICALATIQGVSAIAVIRMSGPEAISIADSIFVAASGKKLGDCNSHTIHFGSICDDGGNNEDGISNKARTIDEVFVSIFRSPRSYTGEDSIEISCHGSVYVQQEILMLLISNGAKLAQPGEFSKRAFMNGKMDLAQTEAVADLICSETEASHRIALQQMRGGFSKELAQMRSSLLDLAALMELELDFSEEDVEFADRTKLNTILTQVRGHISKLADSFKLGNAIKNGIPVAIAGATNTGKSTLLNAILGEERAIVSEIHGTTRDFIEDTLVINGLSFRFIDTAGIRYTIEKIELIGIERTFEKIKEASIILFILDMERMETFKEDIGKLASKIDPDTQKVIILANKCDTLIELIEEHSLPAPTVYGEQFDYLSAGPNQSRYYDKIVSDITEDIAKIADKYRFLPAAILPISAKALIGLESIKAALSDTQKELKTNTGTTLVSNIRHFQALKNALAALDRLSAGLNDNVPNDLLAQELREALFHIGEIVGEVSTDEILSNIFGRFCIGK
jgi:tRNA modification GTPase TrmE